MTPFLSVHHTGRERIRRNNYAHISLNRIAMTTPDEGETILKLLRERWQMDSSRASRRPMLPCVRYRVGP